jgi:hypothetical protein
MPRPDPNKARRYLADAIALHEKHMNGTEPTQAPPERGRRRR